MFPLSIFRESANAALDVMMEQVTAFRALQTTFSGGFNHKSVIVRTSVARLMDKLITQMGAERVMGSSREFHELVFQLVSGY